MIKSINFRAQSQSWESKWPFERFLYSIVKITNNKYIWLSNMADTFTRGAQRFVGLSWLCFSGADWLVRLSEHIAVHDVKKRTFQNLCCENGLSKPFRVSAFSWSETWVHHFKTIAKVLVQVLTTEPSIVLTKEPNNAVNRRTLWKNDIPDLGIKKLLSSYRYRVKQN